MFYNESPIRRNEDYGFFHYLLGYSDQKFEDRVNALRNYSLAWGFFRLNEDKTMMNVIDNILRKSYTDWRDIEKVHDRGYLVALKSCMVDNLINAMLGKELIYNF